MTDFIGTEISVHIDLEHLEEESFSNMARTTRNFSSCLETKEGRLRAIVGDGLLGSRFWPYYSYSSPYRDSERFWHLGTARNPDINPNTVVNNHRRSMEHSLTLQFAVASKRRYDHKVCYKWLELLHLNTSRLFLVIV